MPLGDKLKYADYVVDNSGTKPELEKQLDVWVSKIKTRSAGWKKTAYWLIPPVGLWGALVTLVARTWKRRQSRL
jgi:dephospho-CoA kinase